MRPGGTEIMRWWPVIWAGLGLALAGSLTSTPAQEPPGADLAQCLGCFACHSLHRQGGDSSAPLDGLGTRFSRQDLEIILTRPRQLRPRARMPSYAYLPLQEQQALIDFLLNLK